MSLLTPDSGLLFWMIVSFGIVFVILSKYGFPVIIKAVEQRKAYIDNSLETARQANEQLANIPADGARIVAERIEPPQHAGGDCSVTIEAQGSISPATDGVGVLRGSIGFGNSADGKASEADFTLHYKLTTK